MPQIVDAACAAQGLGALDLRPPLLSQDCHALRVPARHKRAPAFQQGLFSHFWLAFACAAAALSALAEAS